MQDVIIISLTQIKCDMHVITNYGIHIAETVIPNAGKLHQYYPHPYNHPSLSIL